MNRADRAVHTFCENKRRREKKKKTRQTMSETNIWHEANLSMTVDKDETTQVVMNQHDSWIRY